MYSVETLYQEQKKNLELHLIAGEKGLKRSIKRAEAQRPGLGLTGLLKGFVFSRIMIVSKQEVGYLRNLDQKDREKRLKSVLKPVTPAVILSAGARTPKELISICEDNKIPLFQSGLKATNLLSKVTFLLADELSPNATLHGTLVEVFGVGLLIQGKSSVGKSEAALGLVERGHRLISDDVVRVKKKEGSSLLGYGPELTRHFMEIRGIGIINVAHLYGAVCIRKDKRIDIIVKLEPWDEEHFYDRVGLEDKFVDIIGVNVPHHVLPVKPGRDVVLLLETIALNHRLKSTGYNSAKEFNDKLLNTIARKQKRGLVREVKK
jgi:HPr kinase/phosphorylase